MGKLNWAGISSRASSRITWQSSSMDENSHKGVPGDSGAADSFSY